MASDRDRYAKQHAADMIKGARVAADLSQEELATALGYATRGTIALWEAPRDNRPGPSLKKLREVAEFFGLSDDWFTDQSKSVEGMQEQLRKTLHLPLPFEGGPESTPVQLFLAKRTSELEGVESSEPTKREGPSSQDIIKTANRMRHPKAEAQFSWSRVKGFAEAFFSSVKYYFMTEPEYSHMRIDSAFDYEIKWGNSEQEEVSFLYNDGPSGPVLAHFCFGLPPYPDAPDYLNGQVVEACLGTLLVQEKLFQKRVESKLLVVYDMGHMLRYRPDLSPLHPSPLLSSTNNDAQAYGVEDRLQELKEKARFCDIEVVAAKGPKDAIEALKKHCIS